MVSCSANSGCNGLACLPGYTPPKQVAVHTTDGTATDVEVIDYTGTSWWNILCDEANGLYLDHPVPTTVAPTGPVSG